MILKRFNVKFKGGQLERTIHTETEQEAKDYINKKYPKREILNIEEIIEWK